MKSRPDRSPSVPPSVAALRVAVICLLILIIRPSPSPATGFRILSQSASAAGQSAAFTAQADDPSAVVYNPAGTTQLKGLQVMAGTLFAGGSTRFTQAGTGLQSRGDLGGTVVTPPPSHFYATLDLEGAGKALDLHGLDRVTVGVGVFSPFGLTYRWPGSGPQATSLTRATLQLIEVRPTVAYRITDRLSVGVGADVYTFFSFWGEGQAETHLRSAGAPGLPPPGTPIEINGKDTAAGYNLSLLYTPCLTAGGKPRCSFGFHYRSRATLHLDGEFRVAGALLADARTTLVLPPSYTFGAAAWPVRDGRREWKVEVDLDKTDWSVFENTDVHLVGAPTIRVPRRWKDTLTIMVGTEYRWIDPGPLLHWDVALRGGWWYSKNAVPSATFDPGVPDGNQHALSIGLGLLCKAGGHVAGLVPCGERGWYKLGAIGFDVSYQTLLYETRHIAGSTPPLAAPGTLDGAYRTILHVGMISVRLGF